MNTAHTPRALSVPHLHIAEVSAPREDESDAFERAAARLRPAWFQADDHDEEAAHVAASRPSLHDALRQQAHARSCAEADRYRRRLLGDLDRNQRNLRRLFVAAFVSACALLALSEGSAPAQAARAGTLAPAAATARAIAPAQTSAQPDRATIQPAAR